jgi:4-hydroxy-tetrahydrodipicolinate reductase
LKNRTKVIMTGINGKMGKAILSGIIKEPDIEVIGGIDINYQENNAPTIEGIGKLSIPISNNLLHMVTEKKPDIMIDFTTPQAVMGNIRIAVENNVACIVGTTGLTDYDIKEITLLTERFKTPVLIAPNFAIGAVLMMRFAKEASRYFPHVEVIEKHHDQKIDAPSGTAIKTLELMAMERTSTRQGAINEVEKIPSSRGGDFQGMRVHSVRLPGFVAHQEVIFGNQGQILTIRHDSISRESFIPGVLLAIRNIKQLEGVVYGLENIMW